MSDTFSHVAAIYDAGRPDYAQAYLATLKANLAIVEFGAGTGKLTRQILAEAAPKSYLAIEPNQKMGQALAVLEKEYAIFHFIAASAEASFAPSNSADLIIAAQAFHWFDAAAFLTEVKRILKPRGTVQLIWNRRQDSPVNQACEKLFTTFCPSFKGFGGGIWNNFTPLETFFAETGFTEVSYHHPQHYTKEQFILRNLTGSYLPAVDSTTYKKICSELADIFQTFSDKNGKILMDNATIVYENLKPFNTHQK